MVDQKMAEKKKSRNGTVQSRFGKVLESIQCKYLSKPRAGYKRYFSSCKYNTTNNGSDSQLKGFCSTTLKKTRKTFHLSLIKARYSHTVRAN